MGAWGMRVLALLGALLLCTSAASAQYPDVPRDNKGRPWPERLRYHEGAPVPAGYHVSTHMRDGFLIAGGVTFGAVYMMNFLGAAMTRDGSANALYVPVVGPIIYGAKLKGQWAQIGMMYLIVDAMVQAGGIAMFVIGLHDKTELVRNDLARIHVAPILTPTQTGVGVYGAF